MCAAPAVRGSRTVRPGGSWAYLGSVQCDALCVCARLGCDALWLRGSRECYRPAPSPHYTTISYTDPYRRARWPEHARDRSTPLISGPRISDARRPCARSLADDLTKTTEKTREREERILVLGVFLQRTR